jgi:spermidine synthase
MLAILFSLTLLISAALLFWVELIASKMLLPVLGGGASVWTTCLMFFQCALLLGYVYAYAAERWRRGRFAHVLHPLFLLAAGLALPVSLQNMDMPAGGANPILWTLQALLIMVGAPFLALAGTAPLLQAWFLRAGQKSSQDPYFLYAASNLGSLGALLSYPTLIEPHLHLTQQSRVWAIGYFILAGLVWFSAAAVYLRQKKFSQPAAPDVSDPDMRIDRWTRLRWVALAFVPSSLLLGVTVRVTMDVAAVPLFWVIPLALYLLTFVLAFQRLTPIPRDKIAAIQAVMITALAASFFFHHVDEALSLFVLHLGTFFFTALLCHQMLAGQRPPARALTEFYLFLALGGALGGLFNAVLAPLLFNFVAEYPLMLVAACLLRPGPLPNFKSARWSSFADFLLPLCLLFFLVVPNRTAIVPVGVFALALFFSSHRPVRFVLVGGALVLAGTLLANPLYFSPASPKAQNIYTNLKMAAENSTPLHLLSSGYAMILAGLLVLVVSCFQRRPIRFGLGIAVLIATGFMVPDTHHVLARARNFYGVLKVVADEKQSVHALLNGTTLHGAQFQDPDHRLEPLLYYHRDGPLGQVFAVIAGTERTQHVALVGLGAGTVACYEKPGEHWTFFEINPADVALAENPAYFTFLRDCPAHPALALGDARLSLAREAGGSYGLIILDAFSSDSIPIHLMTREAMQLYLSKLSPDGLIMFHISNRNLELGPVVGAIVASLHLQARRWREERSGPFGLAAAAPDWVLITRNLDDVKEIRDDPRWSVMEPPENEEVWTDDYSNLFGALIF